MLAPFLIGVCSMIALGIYVHWTKAARSWHRELFHSCNFASAIIGISIEGFLFLSFINHVPVPYQISFLYGKEVLETSLEYSIAWYMVPIGAAVSGIWVMRTKISIYL